MRSRSFRSLAVGGLRSGRSAVLAAGAVDAGWHRAPGQHPHSAFHFVLATVLATLIALAEGGVLAQAPVPIGVEFQVNTYTANSQFVGGFDSETNGDFVITWSSTAEDGNSGGIFARRFTSSGTSLGAAFQVNTFTNSFQLQPTIALDNDGDFVVAWTSDLQDGSQQGVFAQRFDSLGARKSEEFQVNSLTSGAQHSPALAMAGSGGFVIAWASENRDGISTGVALRRFSSSGSPQGVEILANSFTTGEQVQPAIDADADGDFVVVWQSSAQDGSEHGVFGQRFGSSGAVLGPEFQINTHFTSNQYHPTVGLDADGDFVVAWESQLQDGSLSGVFARRYNSAGTPLSGELAVNSMITGDQRFPRLGMDADGDFLVAFSSSSGAYDIVARRFKAGQAQAPEFLVNTYTTGVQSSPKVAMDGEGDFVVAWISSLQDGSSNGVFAQRFDVPILVDIDGDGAYAPLTDGILMLRFGFGFSGATLTNGAVGDNCTRCDSATIVPYLQSLL